MHSFTYWVAGSGLWLVLLALTAPATRAVPGRHAWIGHASFATASIALLVINRWPLFFDPTPLNPDEAQMAAQAIKALSDPLPWHGFDGTTSGPLNSYVLTLPRLFGFSVTMQSTHVVAAGLELATIFALQAAVARIYGTVCGRVAALTLLAFYALAQSVDFVHYSSEHLPIFLLAVALWALADTYKKEPPGLAACAIGGLALGLAPFAKLQSVILVAYIAGTTTLVLATRSDSLVHKRRCLVVFGSVGIGAVAALIAFTAAGGSLHDAFVSYVFTNAAYSQNITSLGARFFITSDPAYTTFAFGLISLSFLLGAAAVWAPPTRDGIRVIAFCGGLLLLGIWTVRLANHAFPHYLVFAIIPAVALTAALAGTLKRNERLVFAAMTAIIVVPGLLSQLVAGNMFTHDAPKYVNYRSRMVVALRHLIPEHEHILVWGWMPQFYVYTQTTMATKDAHTYLEITNGRYREYFRNRFMQSMMNDPPAYVVDSVAPDSFSFTDRATAGLETFPQLAAFVASDYRFVAEVDGIRVYRRKTASAI